MGELQLIRNFRAEAELVDFAALFGRRVNAAGCRPLLLGLQGDLGSGKTTWARALLRGLGYAGRVPSPTYTLLEHYPVVGVTIVHLDLYRLAGEEELENLGLRDWLADPSTWILIEWPERAPALAARCDIFLEFVVSGDDGRRLVLTGRTRAGIEALRASCHESSS